MAAMSRATTAAVALCACAFVASTAFSVIPTVATGPAIAPLATGHIGASFGAAAPSVEASIVSVRALVALAAAAGAAALIVQNKGGGHGEIGYHLALNLAKEKGLKVTMIQDTAAKMDKPPFNSYSDLEAAGVEIKTADFAEGGIAAALATVAPCEYVFDNQNVCTKDVQAAVAAWQPKAYAYVSSGGMYKPVPEGPLLETGAVKEDNKQLSLERNAAAQGLAWSAYRPQYIYGPKTNKPDYIDWFLNRIVRDLPFPLPIDGSLRTTLTNAIDVAGMMSCVVGNEAAAAGQVFNCSTDVRISHKELVEKIAVALGKDPAAVLSKVVYYDPAKLKEKGVELPKKGKFPFRETHFGTGVDKAKSVLGFAPKCTIEQDLQWYVADYLAAGKDKGDIARDWDEVVIANAGVSDTHLLAAKKKAQLLTWAAEKLTAEGSPLAAGTTAKAQEAEAAYAAMKAEADGKAAPVAPAPVAAVAPAAAAPAAAPAAAAPAKVSPQELEAAKKNVQLLSWAAEKLASEGSPAAAGAAARAQEAEAAYAAMKEGKAAAAAPAAAKAQQAEAAYAALKAQAQAAA